MKKIILVIMMLVLLATIANAASVNGNFEGNPIIKMKSNGKILPVGDVPAILYNGRTMVPIGMLRNLGATVEWDQKTQSVDVRLPAITETITAIDTLDDLRSFVESAKQISKNNGIILSSYNVVTDEYGTFLKAVYAPPSHLSNEQQVNNIGIILSMMTILDYNVDETIVEIRNASGQSQGTITVSYFEAKRFVRGEITNNTFISSWKTNNYNVNIPQSNINVEPVDNTALCSIVNKKYDDLIRVTEESLGSSGFGKSSRMTDAINSIEEDRINELTLYGCQQ